MGEQLKYAFLGAMRSAAQMVSWRSFHGFHHHHRALVVGSLNLTDIVTAQRGPYGMFNWFVFPLFPMAAIFFISTLAETNRHPFDMPEAEAELVSGYNVEYSAMAFALFFLGEYANMIPMSAMTSILFLGGWLPPIRHCAVHLIPGPIWLILKICFVLVHFHLGAGHVPALPLRPADALGLEGLLPVSLGRGDCIRCGSRLRYSRSLVPIERRRHVRLSRRRSDLWRELVSRLVLTLKYLFKPKGHAELSL